MEWRTSRDSIYGYIHVLEENRKQREPSRTATKGLNSCILNSSVVANFSVNASFTCSIPQPILACLGNIFMYNQNVAVKAAIREMISKSKESLTNQNSIQVELSPLTLCSNVSFIPVELSGKGDEGCPGFVGQISLKVNESCSHSPSTITSSPRNGSKTSLSKSLQILTTITSTASFLTPSPAYQCMQSFMQSSCSNVLLY
eukprot:PhF_6_TR29342/c1_g2_i1/m.43089